MRNSTYNSLIEGLIDNGPDPMAPERFNASLMVLLSTLNAGPVQALRAAQNVMNAASKIARLGDEPRQIIFDAIELDRLVNCPLWLEYDIVINGNEAVPKDAHDSSGRLLREGLLIIRKGGDGIGSTIVIRRFGERVRTFEADPAEWRLTRCLGGGYEMTVENEEYAPGLVDQGKASARWLGGQMQSLLAILGAPKLTELADEKPSRRRGVPPLKRVRMAPPWNNVDQDGIPVLPRDARPAYVYDELMDRFDMFEGLIWSGRCYHDTAENRRRSLENCAKRREMLKVAEPFVLAPIMAESAAIVAAEERTGMVEARRLLALPFPIAWLEWRDVDCGLPGQRWGMVIEAVDDDVQGDAHGLIYPLMAGSYLTYDGIIRLRGLYFRMHISDISKPLIEFSSEHIPADFDGTAIDQEHFGRFMLAVLTFLNQPRMVEMKNQDKRQRAVSNRVRADRRLSPLGAIREVRLIVDQPVAASEGSTRNGTGDRIGAMPRHQVRAFWRYRLGKLEFVRPHWRGSEVNGVSRRRYIVMREEDRVQC
ncbi:hypothetical protein JJL56_01960 [Azospirillum sp. YIM DDC1]|uniref:Phage portal protein n=1 Tax=Azospirillum aestuarii TaxID=2802052 RepID=A0ABS1HS36_9PROT|nr:hypothetical protein [Azospirillum aestuarii]MBK4717624.1 hypothetical protein [Azospirillum aestuarii]